MTLDFARSGERLLAMGYSSNEARVFRTFHDQRLGFDCIFTPDAAGTAERCVPSASVRDVYTDADCSEPAAWIWLDGPAPGEAVSGVEELPEVPCPGEAPAHRDAYRVGEQLSEEVIGRPPFKLFERSGAQCLETGAPGKVTPPVYRLVPLPESELARGKRVSVDVGDGLRLTRLIADDGAELNVGVTNTQRTPCEFQRDGECVPEPIARPQPASAGRFWAALNSDCTEPALQTPYRSECGKPQFGVRDDGAEPPRIWSLKRPDVSFQWQLVLPVTDTATYTCQALGSEGVQDVNAPDRDLTGSLPTATKLRRGSGPLHVDWYGVGQSELLPVLAAPERAAPGVVPMPEFVNDAGQACQVLRADNGSDYCAIVDDLGHAVGELTAYPSVSWGPL